MAIIRARAIGSQLRVSIAGELTARDIRRLEHSCSPALTSHPVPLEIDASHMTGMDATAAAILTRLAERGASIVPDLSESCGGGMKAVIPPGQVVPPRRAR